MKYLLIVLSFVALADDATYERVKIKVGDSLANVSVADTNEKREHGLMFVKSLAPDAGMLFVFEDESERVFWMKNTLIPLSIGYFNAQGELVDVQEMKPAESLLVAQPPTYPSARPAQYALEMNPGWFTTHHLKKGARLRLIGSTKSALLKSVLGSAGRSSGGTTAPAADSGK